jgi:asparagine synthase (glutamine-hydrolysing)
MASALGPHGPDGGGRWISGGVGLGHCQSRVCREDDSEQQPLECADGGGRLVTDARIHNREELAGHLAATRAEVAAWPDSAFVRAAVDTWGVDAGARLVGAFAYAHWEPRNRRLVLARSPFCERPLFYQATARRCVFASMPKGLFARGDISRELDEETLADFLALERADPAGTFFRGIRRVPAGHALVITGDQVQAVRFWHPERIAELRLSSDDEYVDAFIDVFGAAVQSAVRGRGAVGLMLSGGLDSSAVAAMAAPALAAAGRRLVALTEVPALGDVGVILKGRYADETAYVEAIARRFANIDLTMVRTDHRCFLDGMGARHAVSERPMRGSSNMLWWDALMATAQEQETRVLLTGTFGNHTISWNGANLLSQLIRRGQWRHAWSEARCAETPAWNVLARDGLAPLLPPSVVSALQSLRWRDAPVSRTPWSSLSPIRQDFAKQLGVADRAQRLGPDPRLRSHADHRMARASLLPRLGGLYDGYFAGCQARFGLEVRDPTADRRVVEFCLSVPERQYRRGGQTRWLVRRAMAGRLPADVLDNRQRGLQAADWLPRMRRHQPRLLAALARLETSDLARRAIDLPRLRRLVERVSSADAADPQTFLHYRGALELGLDVGHFILWAQERDLEGGT